MNNQFTKRHPEEWEGNPQDGDKGDQNTCQETGVRQLGTSCHQRRDSQPEGQALGQEDPLEKEMATHSSFFPGENQGQRCLAGYSPWDYKESDMTE